MKKLIDNPFVVFGYYGPEYFCDREQETEHLISSLSNNWNVSLISPRRLGKTGLILHTFNRLKSLKPDVQCFYVDIYSTKSLHDFVQCLARAIVGKLDTKLQKLSQGALRFLNSLRPAMSLDSISGDPTFTVDVAPKDTTVTMEKIMNYLKESGQECIVAIDEFQQILNYPESNTEALLRSYIQLMPNVRFIFAGSKQHMMQEMFLSPRHPFFRSSEVMDLHEIDRRKYLSFANGFFSRQGREIPASCFYSIYDAVDGQTFYIQAILNKLYTHASDAIDENATKQAIREAVGEQITTFQYIYDGLSENQALLLRALAKEGAVKEPLSKSFLSSYPLPSKSSVKIALNYLMEHQLVYKHLEKGYLVYDRFMALWLARL